ncbi:MAG: KTSC domain-containing protein [Chitinophagaceae bacterium]|nr:KTSC domain-containing protein [Chitinophagaceae bacterium]
MPSSVIASMEYDTAGKNLRVRFVSGLIYEYLNVPAQVFASMKKAISKGSFLNRHIKGHYEFRKVEE